MALSSLLLWCVGALSVAASCATPSSLLFMQGSSQSLGYNNLWRLDLNSMKAFLVANSSDEGGAIDSRFMFTSDGAVCGGKYYAPYWYTNDGDVMHRAYGIASFDLTSHEFQGGLTEDLLSLIHI